MPITPKWLRRIGWQTPLVALVTGGIVHIAATLLLPHVAPASAFQRVSDKLTVNRMMVLPPAEPGKQLLPFLPAEERLAICRFDVSQGPVEISASLMERGWSLALYTARGDNFYAVPAQDLRRFDVTLTLVPSTERFLGIANVGQQPDTTASRVAVPQTIGYVVIRAAQRGRAYTADLEGALHRSQCNPKKI